MAIPAGHVLTVGGLSILDRLQDAGLQNPKVPTQTVYETGNDLVVGKILTEAAFSFQLTSWDVSCDLMAMLNGKKGSLSVGPSNGDAAGTVYAWQNCGFVNLACPWARDTGSEGGDIASGVVIPAYYPTALNYKFGVTGTAEMAVTLEGGAYYMSEAFPIEEWAVTAKEEAPGTYIIETKELARVYRIGGAGGEAYRHVFGVLVNGVIQQEGVDYKEEGGAVPGKTPTKVKIKFIRGLPSGAVVRFCYLTPIAPVGALAFNAGTVYNVGEYVTETSIVYVCIKKSIAGETPSSKPLTWEPAGGVHQINQAAHATTKVAAVRGRNIEILLGTVGVTTVLRGVQDVALSATHRGTVQREMGFQDPIGFNESGVDCNGTITLDPREEAALYAALEKLTGVSKTEVTGYINENPVPMQIVIYNPKKPTEIIKSIYVGKCLFQPPGTNAKANTPVSLQIPFEAENGTFEEIKGQLSAV